MRFIKRFLIIFSAIFIMSGGAFAASNATSDIGDFGNWATPHNKLIFDENLGADITNFQGDFSQKIMVKDYVPIEAKVGRALIGGLSYIGTILENSLVRFINIFMIILFIFWASFETYNMIKKGGDVKKLFEDIIKKILIIAIWIIVLEAGPAKLFMGIMGPVISIGTHLSDLILNSILPSSGVSLPDTCGAIHKYVAQNHTGITMIDANQSAELLCIPTRLSGFFYTAVSAGWSWMIAGIGTSVLTFTAGLVFVLIFAYNIWKFALMAFGVIAELFLGILMLPFTALTETFGAKGKTSYDGIAGNVFNQFLELFKAETLSEQISRFIKVAIYFVSLSIVIGLCAAILSGVINPNFGATAQAFDSDNFMTVLIVGCLVAYLANKAGDIAGQIGGKIDDAFGKKVDGDIKGVWSGALKNAKSLIKIIRKK